MTDKEKLERLVGGVKKASEYLYELHRYLRRRKKPCPGTAHFNEALKILDASMLEVKGG